MVSENAAKALRSGDATPIPVPVHAPGNLEAREGKQVRRDQRGGGSLEPWGTIGGVPRLSSSVKEYRRNNENDMWRKKINRLRGRKLVCYRAWATVVVA